MTTATDAKSGKGHKDENFPVASRLISPRHRGAILAFYRFVRAADDVSDHATLTPDEKLRMLDGLEAALTGKGPADPEAEPLRRALAELERRHLIERRQGRGTYVAQQTSERALGQFFRVRNLAGKPVEPETLITRVVTAPASEEEAEGLDLPPGAEVHRIARSRIFEGEPRIVERITLPAALFPGLSLPLAPEQRSKPLRDSYPDATDRAKAILEATNRFLGL